MTSLQHDTYFPASSKAMTPAQKLPRGVPFPGDTPENTASRLRCAKSCRAYKSLPEDASAEDRVRAWYTILDRSPPKITAETSSIHPTAGLCPYIKPRSTSITAQTSTSLPQRS
ncbi:hypothetical protein K402DRAFT_392487 [Aulographum hederae CBS 113979]|uniref:Uncharacterized protein n=1 Tax=Aulographum hederae CBS 113979 TaxID=1176131 RepID=A0A6G1H3U6_9PEZI|nr:hypothetical protein K402DRAFT_392487 [Aulographum hederae CBS 113979]